MSFDVILNKQKKSIIAFKKHLASKKRIKIGCVQTDIIYFVVEVSKKVEDPRDNSKRLTS